MKRDARLADNACVSEAERLGLDVLPLLCLEPSQLAADDTSDMHTHAQLQAVGGLHIAGVGAVADVVCGTLFAESGRRQRSIMNVESPPPARPEPDRKSLTWLQNCPFASSL